mmetsp:Transcript_6391/g.17592  ORF Transcript_6391/g.17592 Transcript_6391/m.17592 type:complete len:233 (-) Transcript_6391:431-1129(-)
MTQPRCAGCMTGSRLGLRRTWSLEPAGDIRARASASGTLARPSEAAAATTLRPTEGFAPAGGSAGEEAEWATWRSTGDEAQAALAASVAGGVGEAARCAEAAWAAASRERIRITPPPGFWGITLCCTTGGPATPPLCDGGGAPATALPTQLTELPASVLVLTRPPLPARRPLHGLSMECAGGVDGGRTVCTSPGPSGGALQLKGTRAGPRDTSGCSKRFAISWYWSLTKAWQ